MLEKDIWVVWALNALYSAPYGAHLVFKGGTSLSKAYGGLIRRFSEDIDLTYDIRELIGDLTGEGEGDALPPSKSQATKWTKAVREALPKWIENTVVPDLTAKLAATGIKAAKIQQKDDKVFIEYGTVTGGASYVRPVVVLEFGARSSGQPAEARGVECDAAAFVPTVSFPVAKPIVMHAERTFWEKATAVHVYCIQGHGRGDRFARHWYDLAMLDAAGIADTALADRELANAVADHKQLFFSERFEGQDISYSEAVNGHLRLVPIGSALDNLERDYEAMDDEGMFESKPMSFEELMAICETIEERANAIARS